MSLFNVVWLLIVGGLAGAALMEASQPDRWHCEQEMTSGEFEEFNEAIESGLMR